MKGLILKDLMCLRKQLIIFCYVVFAVFVVAVMFVLSARFGNLALAGRELQMDQGLSAFDVRSIAKTVLVLFMLLPIATVGDMANVFAEDGRAGFVKVASVLPLSVKQRVLARYITIFAMFGIGVAVDLVLAFTLSLLTDLISFTELFGIIISAASLMSIYSAFVIAFCILLGYGREQYATLLSVAMIAMAVIGCNYAKIKAMLLEQGAGGELLRNFMDFISHKSYVLLIAAILMIVLSFLVSVVTAERKRGRM